MAKDNTNSVDPEKIEKYLAGNMAEQEQFAFEQEIDASPDLKAEIEESALAKWTIQAHAREEEKAKLDALYQANEKEAQVISLLHYRWMAVAAVFALFILGYFLLKPSPAIQKEELIAAYYEAPQAPDIMGSSTESDTESDTEELLRKADLAYGDQNWSEALRFYDQIEQDSLSDFQLSRIALFQGISHLERGEWDQAKEFFESTTQHTEQSDWYLAILWLKKDDKERAGEALQKIIDTPEHFYQQKAKELYGKLSL